MESFWTTLKKPFFVLAPMADVTDAAYRKLIAEYGRPDVMWTEFVSADGLYHTREKGTRYRTGAHETSPASEKLSTSAVSPASELSPAPETADSTDMIYHISSPSLASQPLARSSTDIIYHITSLRENIGDTRNPLMRDLAFAPGERPIVAQLFGSNPETMEYAAKLCAQLGFDGIDINMGCPDKSIEKQGAGAAMIKNPETAKAIYRAAALAGLPVSIKTRIGYNTEVMDEWLPALLEEQPAALTVHLRTRKEMSKVPAHWELMSRAVALRDRFSPSTLILGNGDVTTLADAKIKAEAAGADGIMLGRAIFGNPWLFTDRLLTDISPLEKLVALEQLAQYFSELTPQKHFHVLKKHFKAFVTGWPGSAELRARLMNTNDYDALYGELRSAKELVG